MESILQKEKGRGSKMTKWEKSGFQIRDLNDLFKSMDEFGGIWRADIGIFATSTWVMSQQLNYLLGRIERKAFYFPQVVSEPEEKKQKGKRIPIRNTHVVIREFPNSMFFETWGTKEYCMAYAKQAAKPNLMVCKAVPVVAWDKHGKQRKLQNN